MLLEHFSNLSDLVAELGGYLGMTLGISLLDTEHLISRIMRVFNRGKSENESENQISEIGKETSSVTMSTVIDKVDWPSVSCNQPLMQTKWRQV